MKRILAMLLTLALLHCCALAELEYITDIVVYERPLDGSTPAPTVEPTSTPTPRPTEAPTQQPSPTATATPVPTAELHACEYEIEVDLTNQIVTVYHGSGRATGDIVRQMICSSGTEDNTPRGAFIMPENQKENEREEWYYIGKYQLYVQYASRIVGSILFHSLPSVQRNESPTADSHEALGAPASHGCIRLRPADSRWIAENCPAGTSVHIFDSDSVDDMLRKQLMRTSFFAGEMSYQEFLDGEILLSISSELPQVKALQAKLNRLGYFTGETDGLFGAGTHSAVLLWQQEHGYAPTGEVNEEQLEALLNTRITSDAEDRPGNLARVEVDTALILRSAPSVESERLYVLGDGAMVQVLGEEGSWYKVNADGKTGYVGRKYIVLSEE